MSDPVSVIITCYNLERYISEAIRSVRDQDYAGEIQLIVVDDFSTDRSREILTRVPGIEAVLRTENGGVMRAMISGLRKARHDMIFFLDGDDVWHREKLSTCMSQVTATTKFCTHDLWYIDSKGTPIKRNSRVAEILSRAEQRASGALIEKCLLEHDDYVWLGSALGVSRSRGAIDGFIAFCELRDYLDTCYQDWPLAVWVAMERGGTFEFSNRKLFGYRLHGENYSGASQTLDKLRRNLTKSRDTMRLIEEMTFAKAGSSEIARHYRQFRVQYELLLASTLANRKRLAILLFQSIPQLRPDFSSVKIVLRVVLTLFLGPQRAHSAIERCKGRALA